MQNQKSRFVLLALGIVIVAGSILYMTNEKYLNRNKYASGALIQWESGDVVISRLGEKTRLKSKYFLNSNDLIETNEIGEAIVTLQNSTKVRLYSNSVVVYEASKSQKEDRFLFTIKAGDIKLDYAGDDVQTSAVSKNGQKVVIEDYERSNLSREPAFPDPDLMKQRVQVASNAPSEKEISDIFQKNRSAFFKCYGSLLQKKPKAKGEVSLSFIIQDSGKPQQLRMTSNTLMKDQEFNKCLTEVVGRMAFKPFQGSPISTIFPLKFE